MQLWVFVGAGHPGEGTAALACHCVARSIGRREAVRMILLHARGGVSIRASRRIQSRQDKQLNLRGRKSEGLGTCEDAAASAPGRFRVGAPVGRADNDQQLELTRLAPLLLLLSGTSSATEAQRTVLQL